MALNFPINPTVGQQYTSGDSTWVWDGIAWNKLAYDASGYITTGSALLIQQITGSLLVSNLLASGSLFGTASRAVSASIADYVPLVAGPGIILDPLFPLHISASVRSVNGVFPTNGNIATALTSVETGTSASLVAFPTGGLLEGTVWVISGDPDPTKNGLSYIYDSGSVGEWLPLSSFDYATADARYLMLTPQAPLSGNLSLGTFQITNLADPTAMTDAVTLGYLTSSLLNYVENTWTGSSLSQFAGTSSHALIADTASFVESASYALTASYVDITGSGVAVNYGVNGQIQITGSAGGNLQDVTTLGNFTSASIFTSASLALGVSGSIVHTNNINGAIGRWAHLQGEEAQASGDYSHAEGWYSFTTATGKYAHAEGSSGATAEGAHSEGYGTNAGTNGLGPYSHAEGNSTNTYAPFAHAEGIFTRAKGTGSHTEGYYTEAVGAYQHVSGRANVANSGAIWILGDGADFNNRSNLIETYQNKVQISGSLILSDPTNVIGGTNLVHLIAGPNITITSGSTGYVISGSGGGGTLQDVTTLGNTTTSSVYINPEPGWLIGGVPIKLSASIYGGNGALFDEPRFAINTSFTNSLFDEEGEFKIGGGSGQFFHYTKNAPVSTTTEFGGGFQRLEATHDILNKTVNYTQGFDGIADAYWNISADNDSVQILTLNYTGSRSTVDISGSLAVSSSFGNNLIHLTPGTGIAITSGSVGYNISSTGGGGNLQTTLTLGNTASSSISLTAPVTSSVAFVLGDGSTNGSFRFVISGSGNSANMVVQKLVSGVWTNSGVFN